MIPFEQSGAPQQEGENDTAYRFRTYGYATVRGQINNPSLPPQEGDIPLERIEGEAWAAYMARAGHPLSGAALSFAEQGIDMGPKREAEYRAAVDAARDAAHGSSVAGVAIAGHMICGA